MTIRANFNTIEQASADLNTHTGTLEEIKASIEREATNVLNELGEGVGTPEFESRMAVVRGKIDEHFANLAQYRSGTDLMGDEYRQGGNAAAARLGGDTV